MEATPFSSIDWRNVSSFNVEDFDADFSVQPSKTYFRIWRKAYGDDYPAEAEPHSFITKTDLTRIVHFLAIGPGNVLVDLGCGRGGPGLWLARATGADLIGIDFSSNAIELANQRVTEFSLVEHARFVRGDLRATGLPDRSCDAAVSIDVVMFIRDKAAVMREVARILRPGAPFILTAYEDRDSELYRFPLCDNGIAVEIYEEKPDWRRRQFAVYEGVVAEQATLFAEMGEGARGLVAEAEACLADGLATTRHVFVVGRKM